MSFLLTTVSLFNQVIRHNDKVRRKKLSSFILKGQVNQTAVASGASSGTVRYFSGTSFN